MQGSHATAERKRVLGVFQGGDGDFESPDGGIAVAGVVVARLFPGKNRVERFHLCMKEGGGGENRSGGGPFGGERNAFAGMHRPGGGAAPAQGCRIDLSCHLTHSPVRRSAPESCRAVSR